MGCLQSKPAPPLVKHSPSGFEMALAKAVSKKVFSDGGVAVHQTGTINKILMALPKLGAKLSLVRSRFDWPHLSLEGRSAELCGAVLWMAFTVYVHSAPLTFANTRRTSSLKAFRALVSRRVTARPVRMSVRRDGPTRPG